MAAVPFLTTNPTGALCLIVPPHAIKISSFDRFSDLCQEESVSYSRSWERASVDAACSSTESSEGAVLVGPMNPMGFKADQYSQDATVECCGASLATVSSLTNSGRTWSD